MQAKPNVSIYHLLMSLVYLPTALTLQNGTATVTACSRGATMCFTDSTEVADAELGWVNGKSARGVLTGRVKSYAAT